MDTEKVKDEEWDYYSSLPNPMWYVEKECETETNKYR